VSCIDVRTEEVTTFDDTTKEQLQSHLDKYTKIIGHFIIGYDIPALERTWGIKFNHTVYDTLVMSRLLNPDRGDHTLEWWGNFLGNPKGDYDDWSRYTPEMLEYCIQDTRLTLDVYRYLVKEAGNWPWAKAYKTELRVASIIRDQEEYGVLFNQDLGKKYLEDLNKKMNDLEEKIEPLLPLKAIPKSQLKMPPKNRFLKDGNPSALAKKYFSKHLFPVFSEKDDCDRWYVDYGDGNPVRLEDAMEPLVTHTKMSLSDTGSIKEWLISLGWEPTLWNLKKDKVTGKKIKTSPKLVDQAKNPCPNLASLGDTVDFIGDLVKWLSYRNRRNVILSDKGTGWLANPRLQKDGRLSASANTCGTNTGRFTHRVVANVPRTTSLYGYEMRSLFTVPNDYYMVGWDASGLESRLEAHYTYKYDGGSYAKELLDGDIHSKNAEVFHCDRDTAKTVKYAVTYGAKGPKLATTLGIPVKDGQRIYDQFWEASFALQSLKTALTRYWKEKGSKFIKGLDGRKVPTRSEHSLVNTLFQSGGIVCMKKAMIWWADKIKEEGLDAHQVVHYHDEAQSEVHKSLIKFKRFNTKEEAEEFKDTKIWSAVFETESGIFRAYSRPGELGVLSIREAGVELGLNVPLDAEYKVGKTWAQTH
jgi:DNA polymerase I-like protein with 3'-5' exonuclease and polymerase domains